MIEADWPDGSARCLHALLVHGAGGGGWEWNLWRGVLEAEGFHVVAPDLQPVAGGIAATTWADYVEQVFAALRVLPEPRVAIGASLGGLLALAAMQSVHVDALVLANPVPPAPWHVQLPSRDWPDVVLWRQDARLASTRRALPDADDASALFAFRHWRDESGAVLREAHAGVVLHRPEASRLLCIASNGDTDVPFEATRSFAEAWEADLWPLAGSSHAGPLLGRNATQVAARVVDWLSSR